MANHLAGEVAVKALGRELVFRLGVNEMLSLQSALGLAGQDDSFLAVFDEEKLRNLGVARQIIVHGMRRNDPEVSEEDAGDIITEVGLQRAGDLIKEALRWATPEHEPEKAGSSPRPFGGPSSSPTRPGPG